MNLSTPPRIGTLFATFSNRELAEKSGLAERDISRWRTGMRSPTKGANVRKLAQALIDLREAYGIPTGDFAATINEVWDAAWADSKRRQK